MLILMTDTYRHNGSYPRYTLALAENCETYPFPYQPCIIRQYGPTDIIVSLYDTKEAAYSIYRQFVGADQPFVPVLDREVSV